MNNYNTVFIDFFQRDVKALVLRWTDPEFWKEKGCRMDSADCAKELAALIYPYTDGSAEGGIGHEISR